MPATTDIPLHVFVTPRSSLLHRKPALKNYLTPRLPIVYICPMRTPTATIAIATCHTPALRGSAVAAAINGSRIGTTTTTGTGTGHGAGCDSEMV
jgi:hypothetical protein